MNQQNLSRLSEHLHAQSIEAAILSNPATITWLTGYAPPIQTGPNPFEGGPAIGWLVDGNLTLVLSDGEAATARGFEVEAQEYVSYSIDEPMAGMQRQAEALKTALKPFDSYAKNIGIELNGLSASLAQAVHASLSQASFKPMDGDLDPLRAVKSAQELEKIKAALKLCDLAQALAEAYAIPGVSEISLWTTLKSGMELAAGGRLPILADLVAGLRTADIGGLPGPNEMKAGDPVIADIVPRLNGYWGDNAGTHFAGEPDRELRKIYGIVRQVLKRGVEAVKPGLKACDLDQFVRSQIREAGYPVYPHHTGHGLGAAYHEEPRIVPYNQMLLAPGMVVAIEPGIYMPGVGGVRLEDVVLVTETGCEVLTTHLLTT